MGRSPSQHSCRSDDLFVGQEKERANTRERMSIKSEMGISETLGDQKPRANGKIARKVSVRRSQLSLSQAVVWDGWMQGRRGALPLSPPSRS